MLSREAVGAAAAEPVVADAEITKRCGGGAGTSSGGLTRDSVAAVLGGVILFTQPALAATARAESPPPLVPPPPPSPASDYSLHADFCLTLLVLTTVRQYNFDLRCELFACVLFGCILLLWRCAAAPTAGRLQRCARWLLARLCPYHLARERVAPCVLLLSHLWSHGWSWRRAATQTLCAALVLALRSCSWSERAAGQLQRGLIVIQWAVVAHASAAATAEWLGALELQLFWEIVDFIGLHILVESARARLLRWLARRFDQYPRRLELSPTEVD